MMRPLGNGRGGRATGAGRGSGRRAAWRAVLSATLAATLAAGLAPGAGAQTAAGAAPPELILRLPGGEAIVGIDALAALARGHDLVVLGEIHDNPRHQALQAELIRRLAPVGLAFEMLQSADAPALNRMRAAGEKLEPAAGAGGWAAYLPALRAAPGAPVAGGGLSRERLRQAIATSAAAAIGPALEEAGDPGLDPALFALKTPPDAADQAQVEAELAEAHCGALPEAMLPGMAEAQRLRDAAFAAALLQARGMGMSAAAGISGGGGVASGERGEHTSSGPAILVAGDGHARRDRGVPAYLGRAAPGLSTLSVAMVEWPEGVSSDDDWRAALAPWAPPGGPAEAAPYDVVVITARAGRGDPCAGFSKPAQE